MDPIVELSAFSRYMLGLFSDLCIEHLTGRSAITLPASITKDLMRENVEKEVAKDRLVYERALSVYRSGRSLAGTDVDALFLQSQRIDRHFIDHMIMPSVSISIHFDEITQIRKKRFRYLADFAIDLLQAGQERSFPEAIHSVHTADQFLGFVGEILFLHCVEVKKLAGSVQFLPPFNRAMDMFIDEVVEAMESVRHRVALTLTARTFPPSAAAKRHLPFSAFSLSLSLLR